MLRRITSLLVSTCLTLSACATPDHGVREAGQAPVDLGSAEASLRYQYDEMEVRVRRSGMRNDDPALNEYVRNLGCSISAEFCPELRFYIIETSEFNAAMAPNGMMLINTGLLLRAETEAELAFVVAHEFGHYFENHMTERLAASQSATRGSLISAGLAFTGVGALLALGYMAGAAANVMSFSRDQEREADMFAANYANTNGYNSAAGVRAWENLRDEIAASSNERTRRRLTRESAFATHPLTEERITYLRETARAEAGAGEDRAAYRAIIRPHLRRWLEMENASRDPGSTLVLLDRLAGQGTDIGIIEYARGEVYRVRNAEGDVALALASYTLATQQADAPAEAWRQIGVLQRRQGDNAAAIAAYEHYLALAPNAPDLQLINSQLGALRGDGT
ncbi:MAG: M48 family metalloprotease [Caulobacterales bacterium]|nr:M48 family metalloprotease [Caulobacterales bacterium]